MPPKTVSAVTTEPANIATSEHLLGGLCFGTFVSVWIFSAASPFLFVLALLHGYWISAGFIAVVTVAAYAPWQKGDLGTSIQKFIGHYAPLYFRRCSISFQAETFPQASDPQTFYAIHPHGAFCIGWGLLFSNTLMQHVRFCFAPFLYASPFFRLFSRCTGNPGSAAKSRMAQYMKDGEHLALPPGGFEEATLTSLTQDRVFIKKRTGFVRLCLSNGVPRICPVYVFGERETYWNIQGGWKWRLAVNRYGLPTVLTWGHPLIPLVPKPSAAIHVVVGAPLQLPILLGGRDPTKEEVQLWHGKYVMALQQLFDEHKEQAYGAERAKVMKLEVW